MRIHTHIYVCMNIYMYMYCMYHKFMYKQMYIYQYPNNFVQLNSNFCVKIATQIVNWVTICSSREAIIIKLYLRYKCS